MAVALASLFRTSHSAAADLWALQGPIIGVVNFIVFLLTLRPVFLRVYKMTWAKLWWFPLLEGQWTGELRSNWPRVHAMMLAAKGAGPHFDALTDELPDGGELITNLDATIRCSLFSIEMEIRIPGTERTSHTVFVRPQWLRPARPQITYVYDQSDQGAVAVTDAPHHRGAACLAYDANTEQLRGEYWTNRQGVKGLNTAGSLILRRTK
jgi:hypothetical protein